MKSGVSIMVQYTSLPCWRCQFDSDTPLKTSRCTMYSLKEYPEDFTRSRSKQWRKFKKSMKKIAHKRLRRGETKYRYNGQEIAW